MHLNFSGIIPEKDLRGRIMGPDLHGGYCYVTTVYHLPADPELGIEDLTRCDLRPLPPDESRIVRDDFGQHRVAF